MSLKQRWINWLESRIDVFAPFDDRETPPAQLVTNIFVPIR